MPNQLCKTLGDANKLRKVPFVLENAFLARTCKYQSMFLSGNV